MPFELAMTLSIRIVSTAAIVIGIALAVERLGPKIGGALAGLPIVIGPAFFFMLREQSIAFNVHAAAASLMSLTATQAFLIGYIAAAARSRAAIFVAILAWVGCALALSRIPPSPWAGLLFFLTAMMIARVVANRFVRPFSQVGAKGTFALLIARGVLAGMLVAGVTLASDRLGSVWAGYLITYPIGLTVISVTLHSRLGADVAIMTLRSIMLGVSSIAAFTFVLAVLLEPLGPTFAFVASLFVGAVVTIGLVYVSLPRR